MKFRFFMVLLMCFFSTACSVSVAGKIFSKLNQPNRVSVKEGKKDVKKIAVHSGFHKNISHGFIPSQIKFTSFQKCKPCPSLSSCVPAIQCPSHLRMSKQPQLCDLPGHKKTHGLCCSALQKHVSKDFFKKHGKPRANDKQIVKNALQDSKSEFKRMMHFEENHGSPIRANDMIQPDFFHQMVFGNHRPSEVAQVSFLANNGMEQMIAAKIFKNKQQLTVEESQLDNFDVNLSETILDKTCPSQPSCPAKPSRYRNIDGTCNHDEGKQSWGASKTPMERLLPPAYEDGIWSPREHAQDGSKLTNARTISRTLFPDIDRPHPTLNLMVMQFGQLLSHDFTQSSSITLADGGRIQCCTPDGSRVQSPENLHFACMPILIDEEDDFYGAFNQRCMNFVRLAIAPDHNCKMSYAKTLSKVTHYIDGSSIYGSDLETLRELRSFEKGQLKMFIDFNRDLLPLHPKSEDCMIHGTACFLAGDVRVNQHITLVAVHLLFAREHNRIAKILHKLNSQWSDEILFEESRRIVVAELQHITYNEWLPLIIGQEAMSRFSLNVSPHGYSTDYSEDINPSMTNEFTGAAYRFGHSTVQGRLFVEFEKRLDEIILISETFNNPSRFRFQHFYDEIMRTLVHEPMQSVDNAVTFGLSRFLFRAGNPYGLDLVALNIQRGRDEALRPYNDYLAVNGRKPIENFHELGTSVGERLEQVYRHPNDVDLFVGGLLESSEDDAAVGPTFRDIIADQFSRLRRGDRYFYEHHPDINPGHFTLDQLSEIKKTTLARIICDNSDHLALFTQSPNGFVQSNLIGNEPVDCNSGELPGINFSAWKS